MNETGLISWLVNISSVVTGLSLVIAVIFIRKFRQLDNSLQRIAIYFIVSALTELLSLSVAYFLHLPNLAFFHFFAIFEILILGHFFFDYYKKVGITLPQNLILYTLAGLLLLNSVWIQPLNTYNSYGLTLVSISIILFSLYAFYLMLEHDHLEVFPGSVKWLIATIFLMHCSSLMVVLFSNKILEMGKQTQLLIWLARALLILGIKIMQCIAILRIGRNQPSDLTYD